MPNQQARTALVRTLSAAKEARIRQTADKLLKNQPIRAAIHRNSAMIHVLRLNIARGLIPERNGERQATKILKQARLGGLVSAKLLSQRPKTRPGRPPQTVARIQEALRNYSRDHMEASKLSEDPTFSAYLKNMGLILHAKGYTHNELGENGLLAHAILDHVTTEYHLMKEASVPPSIIKTQGHKLTAFQANETY